MTVFVAEINGRAIAAFNAENEIHAEGCAASKPLRADLTVLENEGRPLWNGTDEIFVRKAFPDPVLPRPRPAQSTDTLSLLRPRVIARKDGAEVRLYSRPGNDLTYRFPLIVESLARLRSPSCIDREAVACDESGVPSFERIRYRRHDTSVFLYAARLMTSFIVGNFAQSIDSRK